MTFIEIKMVSKEFRVGLRRRLVDAVVGLNLEVNPNEIFGLVGPEGAGKTTVVRMLMGFSEPTLGRIEVMGVAPGYPALKRRAGYLPEKPRFYPYLTGQQLLSYSARLLGLKVKKGKYWDKSAPAPAPGQEIPGGSFDELLQSVGLPLPAAKKRLRDYSAEMLQKLGIAQAMIYNPALLILDEPCAGLSPETRKTIRELLLNYKKKGKTVFLTSSEITDMDCLCDRVGLMAGGKLLKVGRPEDVLPARIKEYEFKASGVNEGIIKGLDQVLSEKFQHRKIGQNTILIQTWDERTLHTVSKEIQKSGGTVISLETHWESLDNCIPREKPEGEEKEKPKK